MANTIASGPRREDTTNDQSLDRGYGGLPGKRPDEDFEDDTPREPSRVLPSRDKDRLNDPRVH